MIRAVVEGGTGPSLSPKLWWLQLSEGGGVCPLPPMAPGLRLKPPEVRLKCT